MLAYNRQKIPCIVPLLVMSKVIPPGDDCWFIEPFNSANMLMPSKRMEGVGGGSEDCVDDNVVRLVRFIDEVNNNVDDGGGSDGVGGGGGGGDGEDDVAIISRVDDDSILIGSMFPGDNKRVCCRRRRRLSVH